MRRASVKRPRVPVGKMNGREPSVRMVVTDSRFGGSSVGAGIETSVG